MFENSKVLEMYINRIKLQLNVEYLAVWMSNAEKEFLVIKRRLENNVKIANKGWFSWVPRIIYSGEQHNEIENNDIENEFEELLQQYTEIAKQKENDKENDEILHHFTLTLPLFEVFMFTRKTNSSGHNVIWKIRFHEIFFQRLNTQNGRYSYLFNIDNIEVVNEQTKTKRFELVMRKKPKSKAVTEDESDEFLSRINSEYEDADYESANDGMKFLFKLKNWIFRNMRCYFI